jgi:hypothetical protein
MDKIAQIALTGGIFALLVFIHFTIDWMFQSHAEAMAKHNNHLIRAIHCLIYTTPFVPFMWWCGLRWYWTLIFAIVLFLSHFVEDTYLPVLFWAKYIRRPPEMRWKIHLGEPTMNGTRFAMLISPDSKNDEDSQRIQCGAKTWREAIMMDAHFCKFNRKEAQKQLDHGGFMEFIGTTLGKILMIAIDQIIHIAFLLPIAYMIVASRASCGF